MQASQRLLEIEQAYGDLVQSIVPVDLDDETLRLIIYLYDDSSVRVTEQWNGAKLARYSYYWLTEANALLIGWDNSPHHKSVPTFPHHKHVGQQNDLQASQETCLEDVMQIVLAA
ncbi:MAG TPA: DUF6516 family protein [Anaerolineae bacterium]|nr:DUF6516 family protein [Anaerolineae bacterium]